MCQEQMRHLQDQCLNMIILSSMAQSAATSATVGVNIANAMDKKNDKKVGVFKLLDSQCFALIRGSTVDPRIEPTSVAQTCLELFEANSNHASYTQLQEMMSESDAISHYSPTHLENICKQGVIWLKPDTPEHLTILAVFPSGTCTNRMIQMHLEITQRKVQEQKLNDACLDFMRKLHQLAQVTYSKHTNPSKLTAYFSAYFLDQKVSSTKGSNSFGHSWNTING
jgi:hypothetical protein